MSEWISVDERRPRSCDDILFTDGKKVWVGWLTTYDPLEDLVFYSTLDTRNQYPDDVTHWMPLPNPPVDNEHS